MSVRPYHRSDNEALAGIFKAQGFEYEFPSLDSPLLLSKIVLEERGIPIMAAFSRLTAEEYFLIDKWWGTPEQKWEAFLELHEAGRRDLLARGLDDAYAWLPPQLTKPFGRKLLRIGWEKNLWQSFHRNLEQPTEDLRRICVSSQKL